MLGSAVNPTGPMWESCIRPDRILSFAAREALSPTPRVTTPFIRPIQKTK